MKKRKKILNALLSTFLMFGQSSSNADASQNNVMFFNEFPTNAVRSTSVEGLIELICPSPDRDATINSLKNFINSGANGNIRAQKQAESLLDKMQKLVDQYNTLLKSYDSCTLNRFSGFMVSVLLFIKDHIVEGIYNINRFLAKHQ